MAPTPDVPPGAAETNLIGELVDAGVDTAEATRWGPRLAASYRMVLSLSEVAADVRALAAIEAEPIAPDGLHVRFRPADSPVDGSVTAGTTGPEAVSPDPGGPTRRPRLLVASAFAEGTRKPLELSRLAPILEDLGFWVIDAQHWAVDRWIVHRFGLRYSGPGDPAIDGERWAEAVVGAWQGLTRTDALNRLVTAAGLGWRDVDLLRSFVSYRCQVDHRYTLEEIADTLVASPVAASGLVDLLSYRFDPLRLDLVLASKLVIDLGSTCDGLTRLDRDRMLRGLVGTVDAVVRTNRWASPGGPLAVKLDPVRVPDLPDPHPTHEIWVDGLVPSGGSVQGVHLRAGAVARGGIRWSDRRHDFRSEVLDLMRTQVLKNAPIVPTGAKGGFVVEGADLGAAYDAFIGALLDVTDGRDDEGVLAVPGRLDGDDSYLVIAADRGTAGFSDRANALAMARGYWLGDAFASGGAHGYDHKALGVTARGAWEAVTHHFVGLGVDLAAEEITVVGIGDLSGDVFGNFALRSPHLKLVAAFDHRHIFCDPDPDPAASYAERCRVAALPQSSWDDYDRAVLSAGGFVVPRTDKRVALPSSVRRALRVESEVVTTAELMRAVLRAPVDLLFAGGVGTFVRGRAEADLSVDDRANAEIRVAADELRARVVGEGANLAVTQRGRIDYSRRGGRINRDALDNVAGVDTSDHEVNLKVLLDLAVRSGDLAPDDRDPLLGEQTDAVVEHVLERVRRQCERLTIAEMASGHRWGWFERVLHELVADGVLDAKVEDLPDAEELAARREAGAGLTRPELAVMLAGVKRWLFASIVDSSLPEETACRRFLVDAFPADISDRFDPVLDRHPLRRELIASGITNEVVDRLGLTFVHRIVHDAGVPPAGVVRAALIATGTIDANRWWARLSNGPSGALVDPESGDARALVVELCDHLTRAELAHAPHGSADIASRIAADRPVAEEMEDAFEGGASREQRRYQSDRARELAAAGWADDVAARVAVVPDMRALPGLALLSRRLNRPVTDLMAGHAALDDALGLVRLARTIEGLDPEGRWAQAAQALLVEQLDVFRRDALAAAVAEHPGLDGRQAVVEHLAARVDEAAEATHFCREAEADPHAGLAGMVVVVSALRRVI